MGVSQIIIGFLLSEFYPFTVLRTVYAFNISITFSPFEIEMKFYIKEKLVGQIFLRQ